MDFEKITEYLFGVISTFGSKLFAAALVLLVGRKIIKFTKKCLKTSPRLEKLDSGVRTFLSSFSGIALYILLFLTIAMILGIPTTSFITALASCGVAIGLALQGALSNLAGGIMILIFKPFVIGDYITADSVSGTVSKITIMYTVLTTPDNKIITIPNGILTNSVVENSSSQDIRRVDFTFCASYDSDIDTVKKILMSTLEKHNKVLQDPAPIARLMKHGDSSLEYIARVWCKKEDYWDVYFDITEEVKNEFDKNSISIPYPQIDIHLDNN